ncbi:hypothetical protein SAMN02910293_00364 [Streptococcus henryi]|uniref:MacB-like core domain-containing protein n=1 Tax=Streptococcus henryi TaxID=439219 RepID=A0A1G6AG15_9STRE|nr:hypothetical protein [Streptococcus henryi]SDB07324.1 hypothetical protein SAMN02910293_00364 [Streptococcus henryi]
MNKLKKLLIYIPLFVLTMCLWLDSYYLEQQDLIILESNSLRTSNHLVLSFDEFGDALYKIGESKNNFWLIQNFKNGDEQVLNIFANDWTKLDFPLKMGNSLGKNDDGKALIGDLIETTFEENKEYVICLGIKYEVIGKLGKLDKGPLSRTILISDRNFLSYEGEFSLNGELKSFNLFNRIKKGDNVGVERFFSISKFSLLLNVSTQIFVGLSTISWVYFIIRKKKNIYQIYHLLGKSWISIYKEEILVLILANICIVMIFLIPLMILQKSQNILSYYLAMLAIEVTSFTYLFYRGMTNDEQK